MNSTQTHRITILTNPTTKELGLCFRRPFKSEAAAIRKAKLEGSTKIGFQPADHYLCDEDLWYVALPDDQQQRSNQ